jgi:hypothetical protein
MAVLDLITLDEFKRHYPLAGTAQDVYAREAITGASRVIEHYLQRRLVYRAPGEDPENDNIVVAVTYANGPLTVEGQPGPGGRTLIVTLTTATAGTITVTGTVSGVPGTTEVFDAANGLVQHGVKFFTAISGIIVAGAGGGGQVKVGSSAGYIEYHSPRYGAEIKALEWPIRQVAEVNEDLSLVFGASTVLVETTDYEIRKERRALARVSGRLAFPWLIGHRVVRLTYSAGYFGTASVPRDIKEVACRLSAWGFREALKSEPGMASGSNATGSFVFSGPAMLTTGMKAQLDPYLRPDLFDWTGERDFDLEAA